MIAGPSSSIDTGNAGAPPPRRGMSVGVKLGLVAAGATAVVLAVTAAAMLKSFRGQLTQVVTEANSTESHMLHIVLESQMMAGDRDAIARVVNDLARRSDLRWVGVLDGHGRIQVSSNPGVIGQTIEKASPECRTCHSGPAAAQSLSATTLLSEKGMFRTVTPIRNHGKCHGCHGAGPKLNGFLVMDRPLSPLEAAVAGSRSQVIAGSAAALVVLLATLWFAVDRIVLSRMRRLRAAAIAVGEGAGTGAAGDPRILENLSRDLRDMSSAGGDEVGDLADAFGRMLDSLGLQQAEIRRYDAERTRLVERVISSQEDERARIARELHDELMQNMSALKLQVHSACGDRPEHAEQRREIEARIEEVIRRIRAMAWELRPSILDDYGLKKALARHIEEASRRSSCEFEFKFVSDEGLDERLDRDVELALYRVAQEAVTNVVKHARAKRASVVLYRREDSATVLVEDDGQGFEPWAGSPYPGRGGLGIAGVRERAALLGGEVVIESSRGRGTMVRVTIPLGGKR